MSTHIHSTASNLSQVSGGSYGAKFLLGLILLGLAHPALAVPVIRSVTPNQGPVGSTVVITGTGFGATAAENIVKFGTIRARITAASATSLTVRVPTAAPLQPITVNHAGLIARSLLPFVPTFVSIQELSTRTVSAPIATSSLNTPHGVLGDLDGDGKLDIVFANYHSGSLSIFRNLNTGTDLSWDAFGSRLDFPTGSAPQGLSVGDADGDGKIDVVVPNDFGADVSIYRNISSPGSFTTESLAPPVNFAAGIHPVSAVLADIDGDGKPDLVVANAVLGPSTVSVHRNTGSPGSLTADSFAPGVHFPTDNHSFKVAAGDLDGDGKLDVVVANVDSTILSILHNTSVPGTIDGESFAPTLSLNLPIRPYDLALADFDGDGKLDIAANGPFDVSIALRNLAEPGVLSTNSFAAPVELAGGGTEIRAADLDGDGRPDLAVAGFHAGASTMSLFPNQSAPGTLQFGEPIVVPSGGERFDVGDLNGDGTPDFVAGRDQVRGSGIFLVQNTINQVAPNNTYQLITGTFTWHEAKADAEARGGHLATITSEAEYSYILSLQILPSGDYWLGATDEAAEGTWVWLTEEPWSFIKWYPGEPNDNFGEDYLVGNGSLGHQWNDVGPATIVSAYLLEIETPPSLAPSSTTQPQDQTTVLGQTVLFRVRARGARPLTYQWYAGAEALTGGTNSTLTLASAGFAQAGEYHVVVTNNFGAITSVVATLAVTYPPATVRVVSAETLAAGTADVAIELVANGDENALSSSLNFDPVRFSYISATLGPAVPDGSLTINDSAAAGGRIGFELALPPGQTFTASTHRVLLLRLGVAPVSVEINSPVAFVDEPVQRRLSNKTGGWLAANYENGTISILPATIRAGSAETSTGGAVTVPVSLLALGNENAVSFSIGFNPTLLSLAGVHAGGLLPEASLLVNNNELDSGRVGLSLALPAGTSFEGVPHDLVLVQFEVATVL